VDRPGRLLDDLRNPDPDEFEQRAAVRLLPLLEVLPLGQHEVVAPAPALEARVLSKCGIDSGYLRVDNLATGYHRTVCVRIEVGH